MSAQKISPMIIFTDGACSGNPGPGGWGAIVLTEDGQVTELGGGDSSTTNNRMELTGAIEALVFCRQFPGNIDLYTDSVYVIRGITQWIFGWRRSQWKTAEGGDVLNRDLWERLESLVRSREGGKVSWKFSRGHNGIPGNERCDAIAVAFSRREFIPLFRGSLLKYSVALMDLPEDTSLPEMRKPEEKKVAFAYLSNLGGIVYRHKTWASCERRVKGQSGAKFKKIMKAEEQNEVLSSWGLPATTPVTDIE